MNENQSANELIPQLIQDSKEFAKSLNARIKVNGIFNEFNENTNQNFHKFVKMSNTRYKSVKSGNRLENVLRSQKQLYFNIADQLNEDKALNNLQEIEQEKKKLNTNLDAKKSKELNKLRDKLRISIKDLSKTEIRRRERLNERIKTKQNGYGPITETNRFFRQTSKSNEHLKEKSHILCITEKPNPIEEREEFVSGLITQDQNFFSSHLNEYQKFLNVLKDNTKNGRNIKIEKNGLDGPSNFFLTEKLNLLSFIEKKKEIQVKKKEEDNLIDINKLMRFTKKGQEMMKRLHYQPSTTSAHPFSKYQNKNTFDTINVIKTEVDNCLYIDEKFNQKRENLDTFLNIDNLPRIEDYETYYNNEPFQRTSSTKNEYRSESHLLDTKNSYQTTNDTKTTKQNNTEYASRSKRRNIIEDFRAVFDKKKLLWKEEDKQLGSVNKVEQLKLIDTNNFLKTVKNIERKNQLYIDGYSNRDNKTNEEIKEFNQLIGNKHFLNKRNLNLQLNRFLIAKGEIEKERNEAIMSKEKELKELEEEALKAKREAFEEYKLKIQKEKNLNDNESYIIGEKEQYVSETHQPVHSPQKEYDNFLEFKELYKKKQENKTNYETCTIRKNVKGSTMIEPDNKKRSSILSLNQDALMNMIKKKPNGRHSISCNIPQAYKQ